MKYALSLLGLFFVQHLDALPTNVTPIYGDVTHKTKNKTMTVTSKDSLACAKFDFDNNTLIAKGERLHIHQKKNATFVMTTDSLERADVFGRLTSKGSVVMTFPGGVHFKDGSVVDVANLLVVAGKVDDTVLNQNKIHIIKDSGVKGASIINDGDITAKDAGLVAFVAPNAANYGVIIAHEDKVYLGDGTYQGSVIDFYGDGILKFNVLPTYRASLEKARKTAKDLGAQNGILAFNTQVAIDILKGVVNTKIQNGESVFVDINEDINIYCGTTPPPAPSCGMNCGCGHVPASNETKQTVQESFTPLQSSSAHVSNKNEPTEVRLPEAPKDLIITQDTPLIFEKTGPCDCGCAHAPVSSSSPEISHTVTHTPLYTIHKEPLHYVSSTNETKIEDSREKIDLEYTEDITDTEDTTEFSIKDSGNNEEVIIKPKRKRKKTSDN